METGRQVSNLTNDYYDTVEDLAETQKQGTESYQQGEKELQNQIQDQINAIEYQKWSSQNSYNQALAEADYQNKLNAYNAAQAAAQAAAAQAASSASSNSLQSIVDNTTADLDETQKQIETFEYLIDRDDDIVNAKDAYIKGEITADDYKRQLQKAYSYFVSEGGLEASGEDDFVNSRLQQVESLKPKTTTNSNSSSGSSWFDKIGSSIASSGFPL